MPRVAEFAIGLVLALARLDSRSDAAIKAGGWERRKGIELEAGRLGVVGCGKDRPDRRPARQGLGHAVSWA